MGFKIAYVIDYNVLFKIDFGLFSKTDCEPSYVFFDSRVIFESSQKLIVFKRSNFFLFL